MVAKQKLKELLMTLFEGQSLRIFAAHGSDGEAISQNLPGVDASLKSLASVYVDQLAQRGLINETLFCNLIEERPARVAEIAAVWAEVLAEQKSVSPTTKSYREGKAARYDWRHGLALGALAVLLIMLSNALGPPPSELVQAGGDEDAEAREEASPAHAISTCAPSGPTELVTMCEADNLFVVHALEGPDDPNADEFFVKLARAGCNVRGVIRTYKTSAGLSAKIIYFRELDEERAAFLRLWLTEQTGVTYSAFGPETISEEDIKNARPGQIEIFFPWPGSR